MNQYLVGQGYWSYIIGAQENKPEITHANYPTLVVSVHDHSFLWIACLVVVLVHDRSFPWIDCPVVVLVHAQPFSSIVGQGSLRGSVVWVMLFPILVSVCASNCLPPDHPECLD